MHRLSTRLTALSVSLVASFSMVSTASAHCDTPEGPVVPAIHRALETKDLAPALRWIKPQYEPEIRTAFAKALEVRKSGGESQELADRYFTETFVRLHRTGEGEPYTGLKPAGTRPGPAVEAADDALKSGNQDALVKLMTDTVAEAVQQRFTRARDALAQADASVDAGREYVDAYVAFVHFVEHVHTIAAEPGQGPAHAEHTPPSADHAEAAASEDGAHSDHQH